ncbi:MAG: hypothetical protein JXD18_04320 [Anaerolineae bacterium]|nr:hypothetical protein [Anaerolineae bacterium]
MNPDLSPFAVGAHRPIYLWAGPGTIRMNRLKFMNAPVDELVHERAHTPVGARRVCTEARFNWVYLTYDWGFPPEVEQEDWEDFRSAVQIYQAAGARAFGYVQMSNCVFDGSFRQKDWYALDPQGERIYYYTGRYMTCWRHPEWLEHLREMVQGIVAAGADGVFFDNPWHGSQPLHVGGAWMGPAGCYCERCRAAFRAATGLEMPALIAPEVDEVSRRYLRWRAAQVTEVVGMLAAFARSLRPGVLVSANDFDAVMRPSALIYGIDLVGLAQVQDVMMIEDYGLPSSRDGHLVNNALTLRTARALVGRTALSTDPYDKGIGFDGVYPARRFQQGIAEAAACGAAMVVKGTEFVENGAFTLLTAEPFQPQRQAIGRMHRWLEEHADLYVGGENGAVVGLYHPGEALWMAWDRWAPLYFGVGQALVAAGVAWRVVAAGDDLGGLDVLFCFSEVPAEPSPGLRVIRVPDLPGWQVPRPSLLARSQAARAAVSAGVGWLFQSYFRYRWARWLGDRLKLAHFFAQSPYFRLPPPAARQALLDALGERPYPRVAAGSPVLAELWRRDGELQVHLVNYAPEPQRVVVAFAEPVEGDVRSPDGRTWSFTGARLELDLDVYAVVCVRV